MKFKPSLHIYVDYDQVSFRQVILSIPKLIKDYTLKSINLVSIQDKINSLTNLNILDYVSETHNCKINCYGVETSSNNADIKLASLCCLKHSRKSKSKIVIISSDNGFKELKSTLESIGRNVQIINRAMLEQLADVEQANQLLQHKLLDMFVNQYKQHNLITVQSIDNNNTDTEYEYHKRLALTSTHRHLFQTLLSKLGFIIESSQITGFNKPMTLPEPQVKQVSETVNSDSSKIRIRFDLHVTTKQTTVLSRLLTIKTQCSLEHKSLIIKQLENWEIIDNTNVGEFFDKFEFVFNTPFNYKFCQHAGIIILYSKNKPNEKFNMFRLHKSTDNMKQLDKVLWLFLYGCVHNIPITSVTNANE